MPKKIVQDVLPPENKSIRNIPVPSRRRNTITTTYRDQVTNTPNIPPINNSHVERVSSSTEQETVEKTYQNIPPTDTSAILQTPTPKKRNSKTKKWLLGVVAVIVLLFSISFLFVSAQINITPKKETVNLDKILVAKKIPTDTELGYEIITLSKESGKKVDTQGEEKVEKKASGKIVVYNKNSASSQKLIANTRFETTSGLIYRINDTITIPGYTKKGTDIVPGSITVTVYADKVGEGYNIGLTDFTIPGFKDDPRFKTIYARSESPMQGGFSGTVKKVTPETLTKTQGELENELKETLSKEISSQIPEAFIMYPGTMSFAFENMPQTESTNTSVKVNERGTVTALILNKNILSSVLSTETLTQAKPDEVYISNIENLDVSFPAASTLSNTQTNDVNISVKGNALFVWVIDKEKIKKDLSGKPQKNLGSILSTHPEVEKAKVILRPFWKRSFPKDTGKIQVDINTAS